MFSLTLFLLACLSPAYAQREFRGVVEAMPAGGYVGTWIISGKSVEVTPQTEVKLKRRPIGMGSSVKVHGFSQDGAYIVREIEASKVKRKGRR
jgi:hypothetical protein